MTQSKSQSSATNFQSLLKLWPWLKASKKILLISLVMIPIVALVETFSPIAVQRTIDLGVVPRDMDSVVKWAGIYFAMVVGAYICRVTQSIATATAVHRMILDMRQTLIAHVLSLSSSYHDKQLSGSLATRATSDFDNLSESLNQGVLSSVIDVFALIGCIVGMFVLSPKLALITIVLVPVVTWIVLWFSKKLNTSMMSARKKMAALNGYTQEAFAAMTAVKLLNATKQVAGRYRFLNREHRDVQMQSVFYDAFMFATLDGIASITLGIVLFTAIRTFGVADGLTAGILVGFVQYVQQIFEPLKQLGTKMAMLQGAFTSIERVFGILDLTEKIPSGKMTVWKSAPEIAFRDVSFSYGIDSGPVLNNVNFIINAGSSLAIVGATGSGKSTIVKLLSKMYVGYSGNISFDGENLADLDATNLRRQIAIVPQDIVMFDGSVEFNISLGRHDVSKNDIVEAARITGAASFIANLDGEYDFHVREGGANLSHGQRQLLVFTRALARRPSVIVLDEATSSVDPKSEALIQESLGRMLEGRTVIIIAHRLNTVEKCQQVLVMKLGQVVEYGERATLIEQRGPFYELLRDGLNYGISTQSFIS